MKKKIIITLFLFALAGAGLFAFYQYMVKTRNAIDKLIQEKKMINVLVAGSIDPEKRKHEFYSIFSINPDN